jgi:hypothetical protein
MDYSNIPFDKEDFRIFRAREVSLECLRDRSTGIVSPLDVDESEPNKFNTHFGAQVVPLPPLEVQNILLPAASEPAAKVFVANFLVGFKALPRVSS